MQTQPINTKTICIYIVWLICLLEMPRCWLDSLFIESRRCYCGRRHQHRHRRNANFMYTISFPFRISMIMAFVPLTWSCKVHTHTHIRTLTKPFPIENAPVQLEQCGIQQRHQVSQQT